jgi:excisionase family DNA binding protein
MEDVFYSPEQIANTLKLKPTTIRKYILDGKLKATKINNHILRISELDYQAFLKGGDE